MLYFFLGFGRYGIETLIIPNKNIKITSATKKRGFRWDAQKAARTLCRSLGIQEAEWN
jgi:hypothetical protein